MVAAVHPLVEKDVTFVYHDRDVELARFLVLEAETHLYSTFFRHRDALLTPDWSMTDWMERSTRHSRVIVVIISDSFIRYGGLLDLEIAMVTAAESRDKLIVPVICQGCEPPALLATVDTVPFNGDFRQLKEHLVKSIQGHIPGSPRRRDTQTERVGDTQPTPALSTTRPRHWDLGVLEEDVWGYIQLVLVTTLRHGDIADRLKYIVRSSKDRSFITFWGTATINGATFTLAMLLLALACSSLGHPLFNVHPVHLVFLVFPLLKGLYTFQLIAKYRYNIMAMYKCCRSGREDHVPGIIDTLVRTASIPYRSVRNCLITVLAGEMAIWAVIANVSLTEGHNIKSIIQLLELYPFTVCPFSVFLFHTCYVAAHLLLFYHDPTIRTLIKNQRFYFEKIMEDPEFYRHHKTLTFYVNNMDL